MMIIRWIFRLLAGIPFCISLIVSLIVLWIWVFPIALLMVPFFEDITIDQQIDFLKSNTQIIINRIY